MSDLSKLVQDANAALQKDSSPAATTKKFGQAATAWITTQDPVELPPPPPPYTLTSSVADGSTVTGTLTWSAAPAGAATAKVDFSVDNVLVATVTVEPYTTVIDTTTLPDGAHVFAVLATAGDGTTASASATATVNNVIVTPPPSARVLPKYGVCPGHAAKVWSDADHAKVLAKMKELAQGKPFLWRVEAYAADAKLDRDVNGCLAAGLTPYLCLGGTDRTNNPAVPAYVAQIATKYKGKNVIYTGPNEPDLNGWTAANLAVRCRDIYRTIRAIDPDALIGYGAIWKGTPNSFANWLPYVQQAAQVCNAEFLDGMFFPYHAYDDPAQATAANASWNMWTWYFDKFGQHQGQTAEAIFKAAGIGNVRWVNDESGGQNPDPQFTQKCLRLLQQAKDGVTATSTIYCVLPDVPGYNYLLNPDMSERPSYQPIKQFMASA